MSSGKVFSSEEFLQFNIDEKPIGKGGFGVVFKATHALLGTVAIKKIKVSTREERRMKAVNQEIDCLIKGEHTHVVKFYGHYYDGTYMYIMMEYCEHDSLRKFIKIHGALQARDAVYVLKLLIAAVRHLHKKNIIHRDLSAGNILIEKISSQAPPFLPVVKLCDFGLAREIVAREQPRTICGTPGYMAPEVRNGESYNDEADVYSLGMVLYLMLTGDDPPTEGLNFSKVREPSAVTLLEQMSQMEPRNRIKLLAIQQSDFVVANYVGENENRQRAHTASIEARKRSKSRDANEYARSSSSRQHPQPVRQNSGSQNGREYNRVEAPRRYPDQIVSRENVPPMNAANNRQPLRPIMKRASSQPPGARQPYQVSSRGESGFESAGYRHASSNAASGSAHSSRGWPIIIDRIPATNFYRQKKGRAILHDNVASFFPENELGLCEYRFVVSYPGGIQTVNISRATTPFYLDDLQRTTFNPILRPILGLHEFPSDHPCFKSMYYDMVNIINHLRSKVLKIRLVGPGLYSQSPDAAVELMENGDIKLQINPSDKYCFLKIRNKWEFVSPSGKANVGDELPELDSLRERISALDTFCTSWRTGFPCLVIGNSLPLEIRRLPVTTRDAQIPHSVASAPSYVGAASGSGIQPLRGRTNMPTTADRLSRLRTNPIPREQYPIHNPTRPDENRPPVGIRRDGSRPRCSTDTGEKVLKFYFQKAGNGFEVRDSEDNALRRSGSDRNVIYFKTKNDTDQLRLSAHRMNEFPPAAKILFQRLQAYEISGR